MCKGLSSLPSSCLEKAKGMRLKLGHLVDKQERTHHKHHRTQEEKLPQDLESLLNSKIGLQAFQWFLCSEFSEENLEFWLACEDYRVSSPQAQGSKAHRIYRQYIHPDAPKEVNLDCETREALLALMQEPSGSMFSAAQQRIYSLMAKDSFPRFLRSPHCLEALRPPEQHHLLPWRTHYNSS